MKKMTSAYANKLIRKLSEDKEYWRSREKDGYMYVASVDEEPVIPEYDYVEVANNINDIDEQIVKIKHAISVSNCTNEVKVGDAMMTIDMVLIRMAQLNRRKDFLDILRKEQPKSRVCSGGYSSRKPVPEYRYINYDLELIKKEYEKVDSMVAEMQMALDKYNQTVEFDVDI